MFNVCEVLRNARPGLRLWSDSFGYVEYREISTDEKVIVSDGDKYFSFSNFGQLIGDDSYPCSLWPERVCRNWSEWGKYLFKVGDFVVNINGNVYIVKDKKYFSYDANGNNGCDELVCYAITGDIFVAPINEFVFASEKQESDYIEELKKANLCYSKDKGVYPFTPADELNYEEIREIQSKKEDSNNDSVTYKSCGKELDLSNSLSVMKKVFNDCDSGIKLNKWEELLINANKIGIMFVLSIINEKLNDKDSTNVGKIVEIKKIVEFFEKKIDG